MNSQAGTQPTTRLTILAVLALIWILAIAGRLTWLQVYRHESLREQADHQQTKLVEIPAPRGSIFDRSGNPLAMSLPVDSVFVNPLQVEDHATASDLLSRFLDLNRDDLFQRMQRAAENSVGFLWVKRKISPDESDRLRALKLDWIQFQPENQRYYPKGFVAAHLVGTVDHAQKGNLGLEMSLEEVLRGKPGSARMLTDVKRRGVVSEVDEQPRPGKNIRLTIDERVQFAAERTLAAAAKKYNCTTGSLVVMNPHSGEILAMVSYPSFDPNRPVKQTKDLQLRINQAVSVPFEPGSVFKVITLSAALETTNLRPETIIPCGNGRINLLGRVIHDHHAYKELPMAGVLAKSSNIGAIQIGLQVGERRLLDYVRSFGFGERTEIPLPAESAGLVRNLSGWTRTSIGSVAMGHEISATTLQLARACSVVANGGLLVKPRLILSEEAEDGERETATAEPVRRVLRPETAIAMRRMMEGVVLEGTGTLGRLRGYSTGGKTGSAQIYDPVERRFTHIYNASFIGFAPVANPAIVVAVTLNGTDEFGGVVAAPVFQEVATAALRILDAPKDLPDEVLEPQRIPVDVEDVAIAALEFQEPEEPSLLPVVSRQETSLEIMGPTVPNFQGKTKRAVAEESAALGLPVEFLGNGIARTQAPTAGSILPRGQRVRVQFAR